ncbi:hypothetical protein, partial [Sansalvadorimonas verongulae]|uniref:hypothetical protein n=1 Tax=Sansalvadorimonas verongulae TaxID=2172824 RepID=UPI0018AD285C
LLKEVVYPSECDITPSSLAEIKSNIDRVKLFAGHAQSRGLDQVLMHLPPSRLLTFLRRLPADVVTETRALLTPFRNELRQAVEQGDLGTATLYSEYGANLLAVYYHGNPEEPKNLLEILMVSPVVNRWALDAKREAPQQLENQTRLGILLYDKGCRAPVDYAMICSLPSLAAHMLKRESLYLYSEPDTVDIFFYMMRYTLKGIISMDEFEVIIKGVLRYFADRPDSLNSYYTMYINRVLGWCDPVLCIELFDIHSFSFVQGFDKTAELFFSLGIVADMDVLQKDLQKCWELEREHVLSRKGLDIDKLTTLLECVQTLSSRHKQKRDDCRRERGAIRSSYEQLSMIRSRNKQLSMIYSRYEESRDDWRRERGRIRSRYERDIPQKSLIEQVTNTVNGTLWLLSLRKCPDAIKRSGQNIAEYL